jgi:hypothetical protein
MATQTISKKVSLAGGATTINSTAVTVTSTIAVFVGAVLEHANIPVGTTIVSINSYTSLTLSANATATGTGLTIVALNPNSVNIDDIALYGAATIIQKWSNDDTLVINDGLTVNVTTNQTKYWKTITVNNGKLMISNSSTSTGITFAMGRGSAATINALTTTSGLASVEMQGNWISLGTGSNSAGQTVTAPFADYIPALWIETDVAGVYEMWTNITGAYSDSQEYLRNGFEPVRINDRGKFFIQGVAASTYAKHYTKTGGSSVNTSRIITMANTTGIEPGASITGTGITANSTIQRIVSSTQVELNITPTTSAGPNTYTLVNPYRGQLTSTLTFGDGVQGSLVPSGRNIRCPNIMITDLTPANIQTAATNLSCGFVLDRGIFTANTVLFDESYENFTQAQSVTLANCAFSIPFTVSECYAFQASGIAFALQPVRQCYTTLWTVRDFRYGVTTSWSYINDAIVSDFTMVVCSPTARIAAAPTVTAPGAMLNLSYTQSASFSNWRMFSIQPVRIFQVALYCSSNVHNCSITGFRSYGIAPFNLAISNGNTIDDVLATQSMFMSINGIGVSASRIGVDPATQLALVDGTKYYFKARSYRDWTSRDVYFESRVVSATPYTGGRYHPWQFGVVNTASATNVAYWTRCVPCFATIAWALYRSTTAGFTARDATTLQWSTATENTVTYSDSVAGNLGIPANGTTYYYVLRKYNSGGTVASCTGTSGQYTLNTSNNFNTARGNITNCSAVSGSTLISGLTSNFITSGIIPGMLVTGTGIAANTRVVSVPKWNHIIIDTATTQELKAVTLTFGLAVGMLITGTNIGSNARITTINSNTQITLNKAHTGAVAATATFSDITESAEQEVYTQGASATATNYCTYSDTQGTNWTKTNITATAATGINSPYDLPIAIAAVTTTTARLVSSGANGTSTQTVTGLTSTTQYTASVYVRCDPTLAIPSVAGALIFGTTTVAFIANLAWQRITATFTTTTTSANVTIRMDTTGQTLYVAAVNVNLGAVALAPIQTTTAVTLNPAAQEITGMIPFVKGDAGETINSGIEIRLGTAPAGTHWTDVFMGTTANFVPSINNKIARTLNSADCLITLNSSNNNTISNMDQGLICGYLVYLAYLTGASNNKLINFNYNFNYSPGVLVSALNLSNNNLFHNWNIKNFRNATAANYPIVAVNNSSNLVFQNIAIDNYDIPHSTQFLDCTLKGISGGAGVPAVTTSTMALGSTTDSPAIVYGAVYDTIFNEFYTSINTGLLHLSFNASTKIIKPYTLTGTAFFGNNGRLYFPAIGDAIEFTWPHTILGVTGFRKILPFLNGVDLGNDATNLFGLTVYVAINTGTGYGSWIRATVDNLSALSVSATTGFNLKIRITVRAFMRVGAVATQFVVGETINGQTSGATAIVDEVEEWGTAANTIAISSITGTFTATENIRNGTTVRAPNVATNTFACGPSFTSYIDGIQFATTVDQSVKYPVSTPQVTLTGLQVGSEVRAYLGSDPATAVELAGTDSVPSSTYSFIHTHGGEVGYIIIFITGFQPINLPITYPIIDSSIPIQQTIDRVYVNPA